jgi:hypothetical protein
MARNAAQRSATGADHLTVALVYATVYSIIKTEHHSSLSPALYTKIGALDAPSMEELECNRSRR